MEDNLPLVLFPISDQFSLTAEETFNSSDQVIKGKNTNNVGSFCSATMHPVHHVATEHCQHVQVHFQKQTFKIKVSLLNAIMAAPLFVSCNQGGHYAFHFAGIYAEKGPTVNHGSLRSTEEPKRSRHSATLKTSSLVGLCFMSGLEKDKTKKKKYSLVSSQTHMGGKTRHQQPPSPLSGCFDHLIRPGTQIRSLI